MKNQKTILTSSHVTFLISSESGVPHRNSIRVK